MADLPLLPEDVADIVAILDGSAYDVLDIKTPRFRLRVARDGDGWTQDWNYGDGAAEPLLAAAPATVIAQDEASVLAPLPGTFYRAPQPGAPPFVDVGDRVVPESVVGIIETMKLMNPVYAGRSGTIEAVIADNGAMVAKGAALMRVR
jgi:acetyl-CoA carboxylase biotin carboxyl carrier protein